MIFTIISSYLNFVIFLSLLNTNNVIFLADTHKIKWNLTNNVYSYKR